MPFKIVLATVVDVKGPDPEGVKRVSRFILELGLVNFVYRADREKSIQALLDEAVKKSGAHGVSQPTEPVERDEPQTFMDEAADDPGIPDRVNAEPVQTAAPELTQPGESQSNGIAERAIRQVADLFRTIKTSFESRVGARVTMAHPLTKWIVEHAAFLLTKYQLGPDGRTGWGRLHGKEVRERVCEFGEKVLLFVPKKLRTKAEPRWKYGIFLGTARNADQNFLAVEDGHIVTSRAMVRLVPQARWDEARVTKVTGTPFDHDLEFDGWIDGTPEPHEHAARDRQPTAEETQVEEEAEAGDFGMRRLKITPKDLIDHGYSKACPKCNFHKDGNTSRAKRAKHTQTCRMKIYKSMKEAGAAKFKQAKQDARVQPKEPDQKPERALDAERADPRKLDPRPPMEGPTCSMHLWRRRHRTLARLPYHQPREPADLQICIALCSAHWMKTWTNNVRPLRRRMGTPTMKIKPWTFPTQMLVKIFRIPTLMMTWRMTPQ